MSYFLSSQTTVQRITDPAWTKMQDGVNKLMAKVEQKVTDGARPIVDLKNEVKNKVKGQMMLVFYF